jgi:hypothetical protein
LAAGQITNLPHSQALDRILFDGILTMGCYTGKEGCSLPRGEGAMPKPPTYYSFLLRIWQTDDEDGCTWRASLERPDTRERRGFATLGQLFDFLQDQTTGERENER